MNSKKKNFDGRHTFESPMGVDDHLQPQHYECRQKEQGADDILFQIGILEKNVSRHRVVGRDNRGRDGVISDDGCDDGTKNPEGSDTNFATVVTRGGDVAINVIRHLLKSGKLSIQDATNAVRYVQRSAGMSASSEAAAAKTSADIAESTTGSERAEVTSTDENANDGAIHNNNNNGSKNKTVDQNNNKNNCINAKDTSKTQINQYRTRHVSLQFCYDGTEFTGFAQNVGKEYDNSVEKTLFAALEKTRLLISPEEMGEVIVTREEEDESKIIVEGKELKKEQSTARTASKYSRCGRTDKGVHAHGQVVALYLKSAFPLSARQVVPASLETKAAVGVMAESVTQSTNVHPGDVLKAKEFTGWIKLLCTSSKLQQQQQRKSEEEIEKK